MRRAGLNFMLLLALCWPGCASSPPPVAPVEAVANTPTASVAPATSQAPSAPLPRSSIAAVVLHRAELGLTDEQVGQMEELDRRRETEDAAVREEMTRKSSPGQTGSSGNRAGSPHGMGGVMRGGGMRGGMKGTLPGSGGAKVADRSATLEDRLDENDTKAYLDAENLLTDGQKERAREIASGYREQLYDQRQNARTKSDSSQ